MLFTRSSMKLHAQHTETWDETQEVHRLQNISVIRIRAGYHLINHQYDTLLSVMILKTAYFEEYKRKCRTVEVVKC